jgi:hypothetical protein
MEDIMGSLKLGIFIDLIYHRMAQREESDFHVVKSLMDIVKV